MWTVEKRQDNGKAQAELDDNHFGGESEKLGDLLKVSSLHIFDFPEKT